MNLSDMSNGHIYVATTKAYPGLVKIGFTTQSPKRRIRQFSTGSPLPFELEYSAAVRNAYSVEQAVHALLAGARVNERREFFKVTIQEAVEAIHQVSEEVRHRDAFAKEQARYRHALAEARATLKANEIWFLSATLSSSAWVAPIIILLPTLLSILFVGFDFHIFQEWHPGIELSGIVFVVLWSFVLWVVFGLMLGLIFWVIVGRVVEFIDILANRAELNALAAELAQQYLVKLEDLPLPKDGVLRLLLRLLPLPRLLLRCCFTWEVFCLSILFTLWAFAR
jgi:hypothetical protein